MRQPAGVPRCFQVDTALAARRQPSPMHSLNDGRLLQPQAQAAPASVFIGGVYARGPGGDDVHHVVCRVGEGRAGEAGICKDRDGGGGGALEHDAARLQGVGAAGWGHMGQGGQGAVPAWARPVGRNCRGSSMLLLRHQSSCAAGSRQQAAGSRQQAAACWPPPTCRRMRLWKRAKILAEGWWMVHRMVQRRVSASSRSRWHRDSAVTAGGAGRGGGGWVGGD